MAYTLAQLTALETAMATGQLEVQYADKKIKYQTTEAMLKLRADMRAELIAAGILVLPVAVKPTVSVTQYSRT